MNHTELLKLAIENTKNNPNYLAYYEKMMKQRLLGNNVSAGSFYKDIKSIDVLEEKLLNASYQLFSGSIEDGLIILKSNDFEGFEGLISLDDVKDKSKIVTITPKHVEGDKEIRYEQAIYVESTKDFLPTKEAYFIIGTQNQETKEIGLEHTVLITHYPGKMIGKDDTLLNGPYVKLIVK